LFKEFLTELAEMALPGEAGVGTGAQLPHKSVCKKTLISRQTLHFRTLDI